MWVRHNVVNSVFVMISVMWGCPTVYNYVQEYFEFVNCGNRGNDVIFLQREIMTCAKQPTCRGTRVSLRVSSRVSLEKDDDSAPYGVLGVYIY